MSTIKMQQAYLSELQNTVCRAADHSSSAANTVSKAMNGLSGMQFSSKESTIAELSDLKQRLNHLYQNGYAYGKLIEEYSDSMQAIDDNTNDISDTIIGRISAWAESITKSSFSFSLTTQLGKQAATAGLFLGGAGLLSGITRIGQIVSDTIKSWFGNLTGHLGDYTTYRSKLRSSDYDWVRELENYNRYDGHPYVYAKTANGKRIGIARYNSYDYEGSLTNEVSCTYYTLRKLNERGLGFPFKNVVSPDGKNWYANCIDEVPKEPGENSIEALVQQHGTSLENIVVSFSATSSNSAGHVLLIDKAYYDANGVLKVVYSDMFDWSKGSYEWKSATGHLTDENKSFAAVEQSITDFIARYTSDGASVLGSVAIGS